MSNEIRACGGHWRGLRGDEDVAPVQRIGGCRRAERTAVAGYR